MRTVLALGLSGLLLVGVGAQAKPSASTHYKYYGISGDSAPEIYTAMIRRGPDVNGMNAYASTSATSSQSGKLILQGGQCRVDGYNFNIDFVINLPKLRNEGALTGQTKARWGEFKTFLKTHEETHRTIWLACAKDLESQVKALRTSDCKALDRKAASLWKKMRNACDRKHAAFDAAEQRKLMRHPFVKLVLGNRVKSTKALRAQ